VERLSQGNGPTSNLRSCLFEMAYHAIVDEIRHSRRLAPIDVIGLTLSSGKSIDITVEEQTLMEAVLRAIRNNLTDDQRHVMILRFLEDFSLKETALIMGKTVGNVKVIQNRAVAALRRAINDESIEYKFVKQKAFARPAL